MIVTRFAPSPTGRLHLGHAYSAALGHVRARAEGGKFLLRIEDLDQTRSRAEFVIAIEEDLRWLGLEWDPPVLIQSQRSTLYQQALEELRGQGLVYACFCTRADIAAALAAPHGAAASVYPGTCRGLPDDASRRALHPHSWRLDAALAIDKAGLPDWREADGGTFSATRDDIGDEVLARKDAPAAYHLACAVDDAASGVTLVTRGADLRPSTPVQRLLQVLLGLPVPAYFHHPLVVHGDGSRLAKRDLAPTLAALRKAGADGPALAQRLTMGLVPSGFRLAAP
jgi:glutamyl-Q tRNA(Asp) synthetase